MIQDSVGYYRGRALELELYRLDALGEYPLGRFRGV